MPPSKRGGASEGDSMRRREENSVRVTNLSEDTREDDLRVCLEIVSQHTSSACTEADARSSAQMHSNHTPDIHAYEAWVVHSPACFLAYQCALNSGARIVHTNSLRKPSGFLYHKTLEAGATRLNA